MTKEVGKVKQCYCLNEILTYINERLARNSNNFVKNANQISDTFTQHLDAIC